MELADDIMSNMGVMSEAVKPISEVTADSLHSVGKTYSEDLPGLTDEQRQSLIEGSVGGGVSIPTKKLDLDDDGDTEEVANTVKAKIKFDKTGQGTIEAINKVNAPRTNSKRSKKLRRASKLVPFVGGGVKEMTSVGSIGMSFARPEADPYKGRKSNWEPARSGKKDKLEFGKNWMNVLTSDFIDRSLGRLK